MALSKEQIRALNRINSSAQKACLGDLLAKIVTELETNTKLESNENDLSSVQETLDGILDTIVEFEEKINSNTQAIEIINKSLSDMIVQKKSKPSPKPRPSSKSKDSA